MIAPPMTPHAALIQTPLVRSCSSVADWSKSLTVKSKAHLTTQRYPEIMPADVPHFPPVPHRAAGVDCNGSIVSEQDGENVMLKCNVCAAVVGHLNTKILEALQQAIADAFVIQKFDEMDAPEVLTSISEECQREECDRCPGVFYRADVGDPVFCVYSCHRVVQ
jgi:hypothetical protein